MNEVLDYIQNPSSGYSGGNKSFKIDEYLDIKNCSFVKKAIR